MERPEERVARRLLTRHGLVPPIDVLWLAEEYASVETVKLPVDADAVSVGLKAAGRPSVYLNSARPPRRQRFTLAHEIGHIAIPWHVGTIVSHTESVSAVNDYLYESLEAEANRFASELLVPSDWLREVEASSCDVDNLFEEVQNTAEVSAIVTAIRLATVLSAGYVFAEVDASDVVLNSGRSGGTAAEAPVRGSIIKGKARPAGLARADEHGCYDGGKNRIYWWRFVMKPLTIAVDGARPWRETLENMFKSQGATAREQQAMQRSLSGVIGAANSSCRAGNAQEIIHRVKQALSARPNLHWLADHEDFDAFLVSRVTEMVDRRES